MHQRLSPSLLLIACAACGASDEGLYAATDDTAREWGKLKQGVIGGEVVTDGRWDEVSAHSCTGVLIHPRWVLTAGHCTAGNYGVQLAHRTESRSVVRTVTHPNWQTTMDLGLLQLASDASVEPATLAIGCGSDFIVDGAPLTLVGYGADGPDGSQYNDEMREASTTIVDADCSGTDWSCQVPGKELIAGHPGVDTCSGDSGGPAYVETPIGPLVAGITSRGANPGATPLGGDGPCGSQPGLYVRTDGALAWIESVIGEELPTPDCGGAAEPAPKDATTFSFSGSLAQNQQRLVQPREAQAGSELSVRMTGTGDPDLYVRFDGAPTFDDYDCRPYLETASEQCRLTVPESATTFSIMVDGYTASTYSVSATYVEP